MNALLFIYGTLANDTFIFNLIRQLYNTTDVIRRIKEPSLGYTVLTTLFVCLAKVNLIHVKMRAKRDQNFTAVK